MQIDKRILKTRSSIKSAFMELVENMEMSKVSVSELAAKALVNRSTFYLHYTDVAAVAADIDREIEERISSCIDDFSISDIYGSIYSLFRNLTDRLDDNRLMKRYIIFSTNSDNVVAGLKQSFVNKTKSSILSRFPELAETDIYYPLIYAAGGIVDTYVKWVRSKENSPLEEVLREASKITEYIIATITNA